MRLGALKPAFIEVSVQVNTGGQHILLKFVESAGKEDSLLCVARLLL